MFKITNLVSTFAPPLLISLLIPILSFAGGPFKTIHIAELEALLSHNKTAVVLDANGESTRTHVGLIHGARALSSYDKYSAAELPAEKTTALVFYCANKMCTSSHEAAERAISLGYKDVSVMVDGVYGWQKAKKPLDKYIPANAREISPADAKKLVDAKSAIILDVREEEERHEVIANAQSLPLSREGTTEWETFVKKLDKNKTVVVHCAAGIRAKKVAQKLAQQGFHTTYFKGPDQWKSAGLQVVAGPAQQ